MTNSTFASRLAQAREAVGMSLQGLADASGTSHSSARVTERHYAAPGVVADAKQARRLAGLKGGSDKSKRNP